MAGRDYEIIDEKVIIKTEIPLLSVIEMEICQEENEHGTIRIQAQTREENVKEIQNTDWSGSRIVVLKKDQPDIPLFYGKVCKLIYNKENRFMGLEIEGAGATTDLDRDKRKRAFQNAEMTYKQVIKKIAEGYEKASYIWMLGNDKKMESPLIQYEETDWEFFKRICSHFHSVMIPDLKTGKPEFFLGMPQGVERSMEGVEILGEGFQNICGGTECHERGVHNKPVFELDAMTRQNWQMGDYLTYRGERYRVFRKIVVFQNGELVFFYRLGTEGVCWREKTYNKLLAGLRLEGIIQKSREESVYMKLDIDSSTGADYPWPWAPETNNLCYCMPETGTKAVLYFPTQEEKDGLVVLAAVKNLNNNRYNNPQNREFITAYHKKTGLYPDRLVMEGADSAVSLSMEDLSGISLRSNSSISFQAAGKVSVKGKNVSVTAPMEIECKTQDANIEISRDFNFYAPAGIRTVGTGKTDLNKKTGSEAKADKSKPEHWQLSYRAMGAVPSADLTAFQSKNDIAGLFACGSVPKVAKGSAVIALSEVMKGKKESETSFPMAFRSMENYVVKGAYEIPSAAMGDKSTNLLEGSLKGVQGLGILDEENLGSAGENEVESCPCKAHVMCTRASGGCDIHVKKNGEIVKSESNECGLTREDIELENNFDGCVTEDGEIPCVVVGGDCIEDGMWQTFGDESRSAVSETQQDGANEMSEAEGLTLNLDSSYMICTKGFGLIYFEEYGKEMKEAWDRLGDYVNEDFMKKISSSWTTTELEKYYNVDIYGYLKSQMFRAGIVNEQSIKMFLTTVVMESKNGSKLSEQYDKGYFDDKSYEMNTRGAGLIQVTGETQIYFLEHLLEILPENDPNRNEISKYKEKYIKFKKQISKDKIIDAYDNELDATEFIKTNYSIEAAIWFWGIFHKCTTFYINGILDSNAKENDLAELNQKVPMSINEYIEVMEGQGDIDNLFLVSQYYVNGSPWYLSRLQEMAMQDSFVTIGPRSEKEGLFVFFANDDAYVPNDWLMRKEYWDNIHSE